MTKAVSAGAFASLLLKLAEEHERAVAEAVSHSSRDLRLKNESLRKQLQELKEPGRRSVECGEPKIEKHGTFQAQAILKLAKEELNEAMRKYKKRAKGHESDEAANSFAAKVRRSRSENPRASYEGRVSFSRVIASLEEGLSKKPDSAVVPKSEPGSPRTPSSSSSSSSSSIRKVASPTTGSSQDAPLRSSLRTRTTPANTSNAQEAAEPTRLVTRRHTITASLQNFVRRQASFAASKQEKQESEASRLNAEHSLAVRSSSKAPSSDTVCADEVASPGNVLPEERPGTRFSVSKNSSNSDAGSEEIVFPGHVEPQDEEEEDSQEEDGEKNCDKDTTNPKNVENQQEEPGVAPDHFESPNSTSRSCTELTLSPMRQVSGGNGNAALTPPESCLKGASLGVRNSQGSNLSISLASSDFCPEPEPAGMSPYSRSMDGRRISTFSKRESSVNEDGVKMHSVWKRRTSGGDGPRPSNRRSDVFLRRGLVKSSTLENLLAQSEFPCWERTLARMVSHPGSPKRVLWDVMGVFLVGQELVLFPFQVFAKLENAYTSWATTVYWTINVPLSFLVGFQNGGVIEMRPRRVALNYARTWLPFDVMVVTLDWLLSIAGMVGASSAAQGSVGSMRLLKVLRFLRVMRLLRLWKVRGILNELIERVQSEVFLIALGIAKLIGFIVVVNHMIACLWYGIGNWDTGTENWVHANELEDRSVSYKYFTSLHWSLTQFTPASMEVMPQNVVERSFAVCVLLFAMVTFSSFISSITNALTQLRNLNADRNKQLSVLRQYLHQNSISGSLTVRIWGCVQKAVKGTKKRIHEPDVVMMHHLPWHLRMDVLEEIYAPVLGKHAFFLEYGSLYSHQMRRIYENAVVEVSVPMGQKLFNGGEAASSMFFVLNGVSSYLRDSMFEDEQAVAVEITEKWVGEAVLWLKWKHNGQLVAKSHAEFLGVTASQIHQILKDNGEAIKYARSFAAYFKQYPDHLSDFWIDTKCLKHMVNRAFLDDDRQVDRVKSSETTATNKGLGWAPMMSQTLQQIGSGSWIKKDDGRRTSMASVLHGIMRIKSGKGSKENPQVFGMVPEGVGLPEEEDGENQEEEEAGEQTDPEDRVQLPQSLPRESLPPQVGKRVSFGAEEGTFSCVLSEDKSSGKSSDSCQSDSSEEVGPSVYASPLISRQVSTKNEPEADDDDVHGTERNINDCAQKLAGLDSEKSPPDSTSEKQLNAILPEVKNSSKDSSKVSDGSGLPLRNGRARNSWA